MLFLFFWIIWYRKYFSFPVLKVNIYIYIYEWCVWQTKRIKSVYSWIAYNCNNPRKFDFNSFIEFQELFIPYFWVSKPGSECLYRVKLSQNTWNTHRGTIARYFFMSYYHTITFRREMSLKNLFKFLKSSWARYTRRFYTFCLTSICSPWSVKWQ